MLGKTLYQKWIDAWNRDISILNQITDEDCIVHQARTDGKDSSLLKGVTALSNIITSGKYFFEDTTMALVVPPIEENNFVCARWNFTGHYNGKMVGAKAKNGKVVSFDGTDIFRIDKGKIIEYWVSSDGIDFMNQLEMF